MSKQLRKGMSKHGVFKKNNIHPKGYTSHLTSPRPNIDLGKGRGSIVVLAEKIKTLETKIKILEAILEMERHPKKARTTHDRKNNGNVKCQDEEQISMRELEYRIEEHYERDDDDDHDGTKDFRDGFH
ncbi:hypothetical protein Tco_0163134 [Tanacetum coccineum]